MHAITAVAASLGRGIAGLVNGLDVDLVTLGGWAPEVAEVAPEALRGAYIEGLMRFRRSEPPPMIPGALGDDAPKRRALPSRLTSRLWAIL